MVGLQSINSGEMYLVDNDHVADFDFSALDGDNSLSRQFLVFPVVDFAVA